MARRKRQFLEDGDDSDSSMGSENDLNDYGLADEDPDVRAERALFEDPYGRNKRRRRNGKDDATYGVFGEDSDNDEGFGGRRKRPEKRSDWTKAPAFVTSDKKVDIKEDLDTTRDASSTNDDDEEEKSDEESEQSDSSEQSASSSKPPSPRIRIEDDDMEEDEPRIGGIGLKPLAKEQPTNETATPSFGRGGIGSSKGGIGSSKAGIGSKSTNADSSNMSFNKAVVGSSQPTPTPSIISTELPTSFGMSRPQRSFVRDDAGRAVTPSATPKLSAEERLHFSKLEGTYGARILAKMGWQTGSALGLDDKNIVIPLQPKLRPKGVGIAYRGFKEKSEQAKAEARRRGEVVSDEDEKPKKKGKGKSKDPTAVQAQREEAWKKPKKTKLKVKHKTYEEIVAGAGEEAQPPRIGKIIDATGATLREVSSLADVSIASWTPSTDPMRIPEVRHNLRLIVETCKADVDGLAKEAKSIADRKKWVQSEDPRLRKKVENEAELIKRLQAVHLVVDDITTTSKGAARSDYEPTLGVFSDSISRLLSDYSTEYDRYHMDEITIAAITPTFRRMMALWRPLEDPTAHTSVLRQWRTALKMAKEPKPETAVDVYGGVTVVPSNVHVEEMPMTPYESMLWNIWLPRVRTCLSNEWSPKDPLPAVKLYEAWSDILPPFIRDNVLDQLVLPKVSSTISAWNPKTSDVSLRSIVFPWLPHVGLRMEQFVDDARRKMRSLMRSWVASDGVPEELMPWKEVFNSGDWEELLLKYVVPKLGATLRDDFRVNPRNQNMSPFTQVLAWSPILRASTMGHLFEAEFFPKWLDVLHVWLIQPAVNFEEVAQWYSYWKSAFPDGVNQIPAVEQGFMRGLQLINSALELGQDAPTKLPKPDHNKLKPGSSPVLSSMKQKSTSIRPSRAHEITFRSIVEEFVSKHNLLFMPAGKVHEKSRLPLYRVSKTVEGKGGVLVYLLDDAVWAAPPGDDEFRAVGLEDMVLRASKL